MKYKEKLLVQTVVCFAIVSLLNGTPIVNNEKVLETKDKVKTEIQNHFDEEKIKELGLELVSKTLNLPRTIDKVITAANEISANEYVFNEIFKKESKYARATAGGVVTYVGIDGQNGICVKVKNAKKIYTYGNLSSIEVITGDRVITSEIIGTIDTESDKELYYQVEDNMV